MLSSCHINLEEFREEDLPEWMPRNVGTLYNLFVQKREEIVEFCEGDDDDDNLEQKIEDLVRLRKQMADAWQAFNVEREKALIMRDKEVERQRLEAVERMRREEEEQGESIAPFPARRRELWVAWRTP